MPKKNNLTENLFSTNSMSLFFMLCLYFLSALVLYSITQLLNVNHVLGFIETISIILPILYINSKKEKPLILICLYLFLVVALPFFSAKTYDLTYDGNAYHKTAIAFMKEGWNPLYESARDFQQDHTTVIPINEKSKVDIWIEHYPKATWIIGALMYNLTDNIEAGKAVTIILTLMVLILSYNVLSKIFSKKWTIIFSLLLTLNPIVLGQFFSYYLDGLLGICFLIELLLLFYVNPLSKPDTKLWLSLGTIAIIFSNLKFTGLMCSGVIAAIFYFYWLIKYHKNKNFLPNFKKITLYFVIIYLTAIALVGSSSYIKNTIDHHNPLYPLIGKDKIDIVTKMEPKAFNKMSSFEKFTYALFSRTENTTYERNKPKLKLPFKIYKSEVTELYSPDTRIGGFGPYFTLSLILFIILFIPSFVILLRKEKDKVKYIFIPLAAIIITMLMVGECWWARYVPQFYLIPLGTLILAVYMTKYYKHHFLTYLNYIPLLILVINIIPFLYVTEETYRVFNDIDRDLAEMRSTEDLTIEIIPDHYGYQYVLRDKGIKYKLVSEIPEEEKLYKYFWRIRVKK